MCLSCQIFTEYGQETIIYHNNSIFWLIDNIIIDTDILFGDFGIKIDVWVNDKLGPVMYRNTKNKKDVYMIRVQIQITYYFLGCDILNYDTFNMRIRWTVDVWQSFLMLMRHCCSRMIITPLKWHCLMYFSTLFISGGHMCHIGPVQDKRLDGFWLLTAASPQITDLVNPQEVCDSPFRMCPARFLVSTIYNICLHRWTRSSSNVNIRKQ